MKTKNKMKSWAKYRQEGKEKYIGTRSTLIAFAVLFGLSASNFYRGNLTFFNFPNLFLNYLVPYIGARISTNYTWNRNEKIYKELRNKTKEDIS